MIGLSTESSLHPEMALFSMSGVLRRFPPAVYKIYASAQTLVRPCSSKKLLISELETILSILKNRNENGGKDQKGGRTPSKT
jgi:hypothetical protein